MAFDKAKALQEANKYVTQGKIAKAIRQYEWVFENEPSDLTLLNVIGDLYAREGKVAEALKCFYKLADAYTGEGYKLKAIAIYKKIAKLDHGSVDPMLRLAELNSAQGSAREAREHFKSALDLFERNGQQQQSLDTLRKLCRLDPKNHRLRVNLAQVAERAGETHEALEAYLAATVLARDNGDVEACRSGLDGASKLAPENTEVRLLRARQALADDKPQDVDEILGSVPALRSSPEAKRLLLESYLATDNLDAASGLLLDVLESNPSNFGPATDFVARAIEKRQYESAFQVLKRAVPVLSARSETGPLMEALVRLWRTCPERGDILELICQVVELTPGATALPEVLNALGDACVQSDQIEQSEQACARSVVRAPENKALIALLSEALEKRGREPVPLGNSPQVSVGGGGESDAAFGQFGFAESISLQDEQATTRDGFSSRVREPNTPGPADGPQLPPRPIEFKPWQAETLRNAGAEEPELPPAKGISLDFQSLQRDEASTGGPGISRPDNSAEMAPKQIPKERPNASKPPPFNYEESREAVEFYLRHGFYQEAQKAVAELGKIYPAEGRLSELRQRADQAAQESSWTEMLHSAASMPEQDEQNSEWDLPTRFFNPASGATTERESLTPAVFRANDGNVEPVGDLAGRCGPATSPAADRRAGLSTAPAASVDAVPELSSLLDELGDESESVDQSADDEQTHYNLGVAFREMGLLDEAIGEFQKVVNGTGSKLFGPHFLQGCTLLACCFMDKEMPAIAAKWYLRALDAPGLDFEGSLAVYYDMGLAFEKAGDRTAALEKFTEVYSQNIDYRDVAEKIRLLGQTSR